MSGSGRSEIRVGLVGYGLAGSAFHAPLIAATPGLRLDAVVTGDAGRAAAAQARYPGVAVVETRETLLARRPDLVVVASPNRTHVPYALAALRAGAAVVVDKPLAPTADEARRLVNEADRLGRLLVPFHNRRWDGDFRTVRQLVEDGVLGDVRRFESRFERWRPVPKGGWRESGAAGAAGGLLYDLGPHLIDQAIVLFGPVASVYAEMDTRRPGAEVDDDAFVALKHRNGVRSHLWMSAVAADLGPRFRVLGSEAAFVKLGLDVQETALRDGETPGGAGWGEEPQTAWGSVVVGDEGRTVETLPGDYPQFYAAVRAALVDGAEPPVEAADAVAGLAIIEAARRSAAGGGVVVELP